MINNASKISPDTGRHQGENYEQRTSKDTQNLNFLLSEFGIIKYFDEIERIADSRQNEYVRNRLLKLTMVLKNEISELITQNQLLYDRVAGYEKAKKVNEDYLAYLQANGIDYQFWFTMYLTDIGIRNTLKKYGTHQTLKNDE